MSGDDAGAGSFISIGVQPQGGSQTITTGIGTGSGGGGSTGSSISFPVPPATFTPASLSGLTLWLDASDAASLTYATPPKLAAIADKSGNGYHFAVNAGTSPDSGTETINGLNVIRFNAGQCLSNLTAPLITGGQAFTFFALFKKALNPTYSYIMQFAGDGSGNSPGLFLTTTDAGSKNINFGARQTGGTFGSVRCDDTFGTTGTAYNLCLVYNGAGPGNANYQFYSSNVLETTKAAQDLTVTTSYNTLGAFQYPVGNDPLQGDIGEIILYSRAITALERGQVQTYLFAKWGV